MYTGTKVFSSTEITDLARTDFISDIYKINSESNNLFVAMNCNTTLDIDFQTRPAYSSDPWLVIASYSAADWNGTATLTVQERTFWHQFINMGALEIRYVIKAKTITKLVVLHSNVRVKGL